MFKEKEKYMMYDYIIVGQGLAGSCMAMQLLKRNKRVLVIDKPHANSSSMVAAGIFNPITGRKMVKTWLADDLFPYLLKFYGAAEKMLQQNFVNHIKIYRPFISPEEQNEWMGRSTLDPYKSYIENVYHEPQHSETIKEEFRGMELKRSGYVNLPVFVNAEREMLIEQEMYLEENFDESRLLLKTNEVEYKDHKAKRIIFCSGEGITDSEFFGWLPYSMVKGEILEVKVNQSLDVLYNRGVFIVPKGVDKCRVGATYEVNNRTYDITEKAKKALVDKLNGLYHSEYEIIGQVAGIRPATRDRKPFVGVHPEYPQIGVFNGLGAKGVSLAPYFSGQFVSMLEEGEELNKEVDISRYKSLYYDTID
jgi:glycine/D-amino acid oxidase-like deaminating enzyme